MPISFFLTQLPEDKCAYVDENKSFWSQKTEKKATLDFKSKGCAKNKRTYFMLLNFYVPIEIFALRFK